MQQCSYFTLLNSIELKRMQYFNFRNKDGNKIKKLTPSSNARGSLLMINSETAHRLKFGDPYGVNSYEAVRPYNRGYLLPYQATARYEFSFDTLPLYLIIGFIICQLIVISIKIRQNEASVTCGP